MIPHLYWIHTCFQSQIFLGPTTPFPKYYLLHWKEKWFSLQKYWGLYILNRTKGPLSSIIRVCWLMSCVRTYSLISTVFFNPSNFLLPSIHVLSLAMYFYVFVLTMSSIYTCDYHLYMYSHSQCIFIYLYSPCLQSATSIRKKGTSCLQLHCTHYFASLHQV